MRLAFLILCLFLSGCTVIEVAKAVKKSSYHVFNESEFEEKKKGVVFFAVKSQIFYEGSYHDSYHPFFLKKIGSKSAYMEIEGKERNFKKYLYKYIVLEPGIYYLDKVNVYTSYHSIQYYPSPGLVNDKFIYGGFEVKGGEVLNIGLLEVNGKATFKIIDETEKIEQDLKNSHHPEFIKKLKRGEFIMPGSIISCKDGNCILYDKDKNENKFLSQNFCNIDPLFPIPFCKPVSDS
jgi:hypothetical protein